MRNLKKILALVLALVMSLSLMATAGAASFQDVTDDNPYKTAIDVLDQLKVFQGFEDGSFKPTDTLNRAQAAVLVYRIATGDVEGKQVENYTYMAQSKFVDLDGYNWAKGYINYCQNAKIVVGTDATHFNPGGQVTGYQLMVMLLRTLGYGAAGEFSDPKGWELETAKIAEREDILKNVTGGDFGAAAPRQMVAEILFRGLLTETVTYSALTSGGYTKTGETLGKRELGLEEIEGVVLANDFADLRDDSVLKGKTALDVDGETYTLDYASDVDDLGESRLAYIQNGTKVLKLDDTGKNVTNESTKNEKIDDILSGASISKGSADEYINFGKGFNWKSDWRIKYVITVKKAAHTTDVVSNDAQEQTIQGYIDAVNEKGFALPEAEYNSSNKLTGGYSLVKPTASSTTYDLLYTKEFAIKEDIGANHRTNIYKIFDVADKIGDDYITGEVYAGTTSKTDLSDEMTYDDFVDTYVASDRMDPISRNENGNWVKVIDNDADGVADYIFKVYYTVAQVSRVKDDKVTLDVNKETLGCSINSATHNYNPVDGEDVICADTLDEGDIVYYALIDGQIQAYKMEPETATIDKVNRNTKTATTTDAAEYVESEICMEILNDEYQTGVRNLAGKVSYDLYRDRGGFLAVFTKTNTTGNFKLVTNAWFNSTKTGYEYAIKAYNDETKEQDLVDVTENGHLFISGKVVNQPNRVQNNDWNALKYLGGTVESNGAENNIKTVDGVGYPAALNGSTRTTMYRGEEVTDNRIKTTVVAMGDDGLIMPVDNVSVSSRRTHRIIDIEPDVRGNYTIPGRDYGKGVAYTTVGSNTAYNALDGANKNAATVEVRALSTTTYYFVYPTFNAANDVGVVAYTGYGAVPSLSADAKNAIEDIYVVGTQTDRVSTDENRGSKYYTADVVVVEFNEDYLYDTELVFLVDAYEVHSNISDNTATVIFSSDGRSEDVELDTDALHGIANNRRLEPSAYIVRKTGEATYSVVDKLDNDDLTKYNWFAGQIRTELGTYEADHFEIRNFITGTPVTGHNVAVKATDSYKTFRLTEDSKVYTLNYTPDRTSLTPVNDWDDQRATLTLAEDQHDLKDALAERVNKSTSPVDRSYVYDHELLADRQRYGNRNDVMVFAKSNGDVIFAVSFENIDSDMEYRDYAQDVWENVVPGTKAPASKAVVEFCRVRDGQAGDLDGAVDKTITVSLGTAEAAQRIGDMLYITGEKNSHMTSTDNSSAASVKFADPIVAGTYYLWVTNQDDTIDKYTLVVSAAVPDALVVDDDVVVELADGRWDVTDPATTLLPEFHEALQNANPDGSVRIKATTKTGLRIIDETVTPAVMYDDYYTTRVDECRSIQVWLYKEGGIQVAECYGTIDYKGITFDTTEATVTGGTPVSTYDEPDTTNRTKVYLKGTEVTITAKDGAHLVIDGDDVAGAYTLIEDVTITTRGNTPEEQKAADEADIAAAKQLIDALTMPTDAAENGDNEVFTENTLKALLANIVNTGLAAGAAAGDEPAAFPDTVEVTADDITITDPADLSDIATWAAGVEKTIKFTVSIDVKEATSTADPATSKQFTVEVVWYDTVENVKKLLVNADDNSGALDTLSKTVGDYSDEDAFKNAVKDAIAGAVESVETTDITVTVTDWANKGASGQTLSYSYSFNYGSYDVPITANCTITFD